MASLITYVFLIFATILRLNTAQNVPGGRLLENQLKFLTAQPFNDFDWKLSKALDKNEQSNFVVSPLSVKLSIAMLYLGLQGLPAREIEDALKINSTLRETVELKFSTIMKSLDSKEESYELNIGTRLFLDKSSQINGDFEKKLKEYYNSSIQQVEFQQRMSAIAEINDWCSRITKGKIQQLISEDDINDGTAMMLLNAIYFRGEWENPFAENETKYDTFWVSDKKQVTVQMMSLKEKLCYYNIRELKAHLLRLPYVGKKFAMYIIYPHDVDGLPALAANINPEILAKSLKLMKEQLVSLRLPKFKFESTATLVPILKMLNIKELFSDKANLESIARSPKGPLMISNIIQKSGIEVNEKGSTAFASTNVVIDSRFGNDAIQISVQRPFAFLIADESKDTIIFTGKVIDPSTFKFPPPMSSLPSEGLQSENLANRIQPGPGQGQVQLNDRYNYFDKELLLRTAQANLNSNVVLSPASIKATLALLLEGASGLTEKELIDALRLPKNKQLATAALQAQFNALKNANSAVIIDSKNKIFIAQDEKLSQRYSDTIHNQYGSEIDQINFAKPEEASNTINTWVNEVTKGLIPSLVTKDDFDSSTRLFLANCIYFKGEWQTAFEARKTHNDCFYTSANVCQKAALMSTEFDLNYHEAKDLDAKLLELPFKDERYSFVIVLPNKVDGVYSLLKDLQHRSILELFDQMKSETVYVTLPRTTIEFASPLATPLSQLDIKDMFTSTANLSGVLDMNKPITVKDIVHKAKIEITENGAKAAAASGIQVVLLSASPSSEFKANHPFIFFIRDKREPGFLFEGILMSPDKVPDQKPVQSPSSNRVQIPQPQPPGQPQRSTTRAPNVRRPPYNYQAPRPTEKGSIEAYAYVWGARTRVHVPPQTELGPVLVYYD